VTQADAIFTKVREHAAALHLFDSSISLETGEHILFNNNTILFRFILGCYYG